MNSKTHYEINDWEDEELNLKPTLLRGIYSYGFENPSSIQKKALYPMTLNKDKKNNKLKDIIAQAQSGTGKTGAFGIGTLQIIDESKLKTQALILAPTHELASQIQNVISSIGTYLKINVKLLVGGVPVEKDREEMERSKPHIVVGTPGRIQDMIRRKYLKTEDLQIIVLDEADEMLSSGFNEQVYKILHNLPESIQVALFSATMPPEVEQLASEFMLHPNKILVKTEELTLQGIAQYYVNVMNDVQKYETLKDLFAGVSISQAIIYCNSTTRVDELYEAMEHDKFPVQRIHGKMSQEERKQVYKDFKTGGCRVLISSDLFARGIDVQQVSIVINFDIPKNVNTYLHRIGRSGRWGRKGISINFQSKYDIIKLNNFRKHYNTEIHELPMDYRKHFDV
jgi:translation initiation factor 4A